MPYQPLPTTPVDFPTTYAINCFEVQTDFDFELMIHGTDQRRTLETSPAASSAVTALCGTDVNRAHTPVAFAGSPGQPVASHVWDGLVSICPVCTKLARHYEDAA